ncbi:MAG TPA: hypothetical protein VK937_18355 [Candidatus Limnocylindria bacterium]|nr:hypothetical protein [Candidatus Limnocylindria bacterium]
MAQHAAPLPPTPLRFPPRSFFLRSPTHPSESPRRRPHPVASFGRKIRQQLQVLRDLGLLEFLGSGSYRLR